jgi:hypothetical protein
MPVEQTDIPRYRCDWCGRVTYLLADVEHEYCSCCGSADGLLPKDCEHHTEQIRCGVCRSALDLDGTCPQAWDEAQ